MNTIKAQTLYNCREEAEQISGTDLHDLFRLVCDGEPSPEGATRISVEALEQVAKDEPYYAEFIADAVRT